MLQPNLRLKSLRWSSRAKLARCATCSECGAGVYHLILTRYPRSTKSKRPSFQTSPRSRCSSRHLKVLKLSSCIMLASWDHGQRCVRQTNVENPVLSSDCDHPVIQHKKDPIVAVFETQANLADHEKITGLDGVMQSPST